MGNLGFLGGFNRRFRRFNGFTRMLFGMTEIPLFSWFLDYNCLASPLWFIGPDLAEGERVSREHA